MSNEAFFYPQKMGKLILLGLEEVISKNGVTSVLELMGQNDFTTLEKKVSFESISLLLQTLEKVYGPRGGRGLALRTGRACFKYGLKEYGSLMGITEMAFRLLPLPTKLRVGTKAFADLFNKHTDQIVCIEEDEHKFFWHIERCPLCWGRTSNESVCHLAVGLLQEALYWVSGGKVFNVEQISCIACGDASCTIVFDKVPLS